MSETGPDRQRPADAQHPPLPGLRRRRARPSLELVRAGGTDREATEVWEGGAELRLYDDTLEDLQAIAPHEVLKGFRFSFGYTVDGGEVVAQHDKEAMRP